MKSDVVEFVKRKRYFPDVIHKRGLKRFVETKRMLKIRINKENIEKVAFFIIIFSYIDKVIFKI